MAYNQEYQRKYYLDRREQKIQYEHDNRDRANQRRRELHAGRPKRRTWPFMQTRLEAMQIVSGQEVPICVKCGYTNMRALVINHKNGGGNLERKGERKLSGRTLYKAIVLGTRSKEDLDIRCHNCNILYEYERGRLSGWDS